MKRFGIVLLSLCLTWSSCGPNGVEGNSGAILVGAQVGGLVGSIVGYGNGGRGSYRNEMLGSLIGTVAGAVVGNAISTPKRSEYQESYGPNNEIYYSNRDSSRPDYGTTYVEEQYPIMIRNIRFADDSKNQTINPGEQSSITFNIVNVGGNTMTNLVPVVELADKSSRFTISPPVVIDRLNVDEAVGYTAYVLAGKKLKNSEVVFRISVRSGNRCVSNVREFSILTSRE